jgi:hypothetical protein
MECNDSRHIQEALEAARLLNVLADEADAQSRECGCTLVGAVMRDCAYKIKRAADQERRIRVQRGEWEQSSASTLFSSALFREKTQATGETVW